MTTVRRDKEGWIRCGKCGHKLFRITCGCEGGQSPVIEIKCHSCKELNEWQYGAELKVADKM